MMNSISEPPCCTDRADWHRELGGVGRRPLPGCLDPCRAVQSQGSLSPPHFEAATPGDQLGRVRRRYACPRQPDGKLVPRLTGLPMAVWITENDGMCILSKSF